MADISAAGGRALGMIVTMAKPQDQARIDATRTPAGGYRKAS
jgi:hypothetical protein